MPVMDGLQATKSIRKILDEYMEEHPTLKVDVRETMIVAMTANDTAEDRQKCIDAGMDDFLSKPPNMNDFKKVLIQVFGKELVNRDQ